MAIDVEAMLADLGRSWDASVQHVDLLDVIERHDDAVSFRPSPTVSAGDLTRPRAWRRRAVVYVALAAACIAALVVILTARATRPVVTNEPTTPTTTTLAATTVPPTTAGVGTWRSVGRLAADCGPCTDGKVLPDGRVVIVGGVLDGTSVIQIYDPQTTTFRVAGTLPDGVGVGRIAGLNDGRLLLTGGGGAVVIYNPADGSLDVLRRPSQTAQGGVTATQLADGRVLLFGASRVQWLDPITGTFSDARGTSSIRRAEPPGSVTPLPDGTVLVADSAGAEIYDPAQGAFSRFDDGKHPTGGVLPLADGRLLLTAPYPKEIYDPATRTFTTVELAPPDVPVAVLHDGRVLTRYYPRGQGPLEPVVLELHDLTTGDTVRLAKPTGYRFGAVPVVLGDDRILLFGVYPGNAQGSPAATPDMRTAELFSVEK